MDLWTALIILAAFAALLVAYWPRRTVCDENEDAPEAHGRIAIKSELIELTTRPLPPHIKIVPEDEEQFAFRCGHTSFRTYHIKIWDELVKPNEFAISQTDYCPECATKIDLLAFRIIRCPICAKPIFKGYEVVLVHDDGTCALEGIERHGEHIIACMRMDCCPCGGLYAGNWNGERFVSFTESGTVREVPMSNP
jgi:hypothetical protein